MALDNAQFISELSITDPPGTDPLSEGDDQIRTTKRATQQSFPNIDAAVTLTAAQLNDAALKGADPQAFTGLNSFANPAVSSLDGSILLNSDIPILGFQEPGAALDQKVWDITVFQAEFRIRTADDVGGANINAISIDRVGTSVNSVNLHQGASGLKRFATAAGGVAELRSDGNTDAEARRLNLTHQDGTIRALVGFTTTDEFRLRNEVDGGNLAIFGRDVGSAIRTFLSGDPDGQTTLRGVTFVTLQVGTGGINALRCTDAGSVSEYFNGIIRTDTQAAGAFRVRSDTSTDIEPKQILFSHQDGTLRGFVGYGGEPTMKLENRINSGLIEIVGRDSGAISRIGLSLDPDGNTAVRGKFDVLLQPDNGDPALRCAQNAQVEMAYNTTLMARTALAGNGGFEVNNSVTGSGFERVLTAGGDRIYYGGFVASAGAVGSNLPTGWSVVRNSAGNYTVTHNLGLASLTELGISASLIQAIVTFDTDVQLQSLTTSSFTVNTILNGAAFDSDWMFTAVDQRTL